MRSKTLHTTIFTLHRWLGLLAGLVLTIVGITGSLLVFQKEWDSWLIRQQFGAVIATTPPLEIDRLVEMVATAYTNVKGAIPAYVSIPPNPATPYTIGFQLGEQYWDVFVNPTTGKVLGERQWETSIVGRLYDLHIH